MFSARKLSCIVLEMVLTQEVVSHVVFTPGVIIIDLFGLLSALKHGDQLFIKLGRFHELALVVVFTGFPEFHFIVCAFDDAVKMVAGRNQQSNENKTGYEL